MGLQVFVRALVFFAGSGIWQNAYDTPACSFFHKKKYINIKNTHTLDLKYKQTKIFEHRFDQLIRRLIGAKYTVND